MMRAIVNRSTGAGSVSTMAPEAMDSQTSASVRLCTALRGGVGGSISSVGARTIRAVDGAGDGVGDSEGDIGDDMGSPFQPASTGIQSKGKVAMGAGGAAAPPSQ
jgi:hypothetical protein